MGTTFFDQQLANSHFAHHFKKPQEKNLKRLVTTCCVVVGDGES